MTKNDIYHFWSLFLILSLVPNLTQIIMGIYRNRPKGNYIQEATWDKLFFLTKTWKDDLLFYKQDLKFLIRLMDIYFIKLVMLENLDELREVQINIFKSLKDCSSLIDRIDIHLEHLSDIIDESSIYDSFVFRGEQELLEDDISDFNINVKLVRKDAFSITKEALEQEKSKYIWKSN